jgi:hypothetical protein
MGTLLEAKDAYCTNCEKITYFILVDEGYECQNCKGINTMRGLKDINEDPSMKADTVVDLYRPDDIE